MSSELSREEIDGYRTLCVKDIRILCDMAESWRAHCEAGRVSVPNDAASYPRDNALEVARSMEIAVIAWKAAHGNETLKHPDQSLLARSFLAVASELTWRDQLSAAPAPAAQDVHDDAGGRQE